MDAGESRFRVRLVSGETYGPTNTEGLRQWASEGRLPRDAVLIIEGTDEEVPVTQVPAITPLVLAPPTVSTGMVLPAGAGGDGYSGIVPYRNVPALAAYYLGLLSLLPMVGVLLGAAALVLGIIGLSQRARRPEIKGAAHAWIGIILGGLMMLIWAALIIALLLAP